MFEKGQNKNIKQKIEPFIYVPCVLNKHVKAFAPTFLMIHSVHTKGLFLSNCAYKFVQNLVSEHLSFAKVIYSSDRCGLLRRWSNSKIIAQVCRWLLTIQGQSEMRSFTHKATDVTGFPGSVRLACWQKQYPPELFPVNLMFNVLCNNHAI